MYYLLVRLSIREGRIHKPKCTKKTVIAIRIWDNVRIEWTLRWKKANLFEMISMYFNYVITAANGK